MNTRLQPATPTQNGYHRSFNRLLYSRAIPLPLGGDYSGIRAVYLIGRVLSWDIDRELIMAETNARAQALQIELDKVNADWEAWKDRQDDEGYADAAEHYNNEADRIYAAAHEVRADSVFIVGDHLIDRFEWDYEGKPPNPHDAQSMWQLEPEGAQRAGKRAVLEYLISPAWLQKVAEELTDPKPSAPTT
jgi:hypothetical protein